MNPHSLRDTGNPAGTFESHGKSTPKWVALSAERAELLRMQGTPRAPQVRPEQLAITHTPCDSHMLLKSKGGFSLLSPFLFPEDMSGLALEAPNSQPHQGQGRGAPGGACWAGQRVPDSGFWAGLDCCVALSKDPLPGPWGREKGKRHGGWAQCTRGLGGWLAGRCWTGLGEEPSWAALTQGEGQSP